jgi:hypothetical protein
MQTTVNIDDDLLRRLQEDARREGVPLAELVNRLLRGVVRFGRREQAASPYREKTFAMGAPRVNLDKALALAASLDDEETHGKMTRGDADFNRFPSLRWEEPGSGA